MAEFTPFFYIAPSGGQLPFEFLAARRGAVGVKEGFDLFAKFAEFVREDNIG